ncbi:uncharacterized protein LOC131599187 [Vicia villosa]|uniref:uncharacterized protein LOC131599187 n=1 Tax=Vicia villosa TaxID=3911 RepID=UPI00273C1B5C|nr:uncharacterized protein LOC131599187 [Vicia villosa]
MDNDLSLWNFQGIFIGHEICMDVTCHWLVTNCTRGGHREITLLSIDLSDEVFLTTPIREESSSPYIFDNFLTMLNGSIALISNHHEDDVFDIFILGELGVSESWIKVCTYGPLPSIHWPQLHLGRRDICLKDKVAKDHELYELAYYDELANG